MSERQATNGPAMFISYRREDVPGHAGRLYDRLEEHFGTSRVFIDVDSIALGVDFVEALERALRTCEVLLVLIGPRWLEARTGEGRRRLHSPDDYVRLEVQTALERGLRVVPILAEDATLPSTAELPEPLHPLARRQAMELHDATFRSDVRSMIERLDAELSKEFTSAERRNVDASATAPPRPDVDDAEPPWTATCLDKTAWSRRIETRLTHSRHEVVFRTAVLGSWVHLDGKRVAKSGIVRGGWTKTEEFAFDVVDGSDLRAAIVTVRHDNRPIDTLTLRVDGRVLYDE